MKSAEMKVLARAARQHTVFSTSQAFEDGMTARQLELRRAAGRLTVVHRGVQGLTGVPPTLERSLMAACLATAGVVSHRSAAALWELRGCESGLVEVTVCARRRPELAGVISHRTERLDAVDVAERRGIPVTSPARTLLDLGAVAEADTVGTALEDAVFRGLVSIRWLERTVQRLGRPGRNGVGVLRELLEARDPHSGPTESVLEDEFIQLCCAAGLPEPRRQYTVIVRGGPSVRLDFAYPDVLLGIEVNGRRWHSGRADLQRDCAKHNVLVGLGWLVLTFTADDVRRRRRQVTAQVRRALELAQAS